MLRSRDAHVAANLSSMAQGFGYTLASLGPFAVGLVHDWTGGWSAIGWIFAVLGLGAIAAGLGAGRAQYVQVTSEKLSRYTTSSVAEAIQRGVGAQVQVLSWH